MTMVIEMTTVYGPPPPGVETIAADELDPAAGDLVRDGEAKKPGKK